MRKTVIPFVPDGILHLHENGKLLSEEQIQILQSKIIQPGKYNKQISHCGFSVLFIQHKFIVICPTLKFAATEGGFGKVKLGQDMATGEWVAIKIMPCSIEQTGVTLSLENELLKKSIDNEAKHLKTVGLAIVDQQQQPLQTSFYSRKKATHKQHLIVMKWVGGSTEQAYFTKLPLVMQLDLLLQILRQTQRVHALGLLHRDLKFDNFIIDYARMQVTLVDFGLSDYMNQSGELFDKNSLGNVDYRAPELFNVHDKNLRKELASNDKNAYQALFLSASPSSDVQPYSYSYNEKTEIYSLGMMIKVLGENNPCLMTIKEWLLPVVEAMLHKNPLQRPSLAEVVTFFAALRAQLTYEQRVIRIAWVKIEEYPFSAIEAERNQFFLHLKKYDQIILTHETLASEIHHYLQIINDFKKRGIVNVLPEVWHPERTNNLIAMQTQLNQTNPFYHYELMPVSVDEILRSSSFAMFTKNLSTFNQHFFGYRAGRRKKTSDMNAATPCCLV